MQILSVEQVYTSVACNRTPEIVDWNDKGLICFGANFAVVIYDTKRKTPLTVLSHHKARINSVKWVKNRENTCTELLSCSADKTAAIWALESGAWKVTSKLTGHTDGVSCVFGIYIGDDLVVYTASTDSTIRVWKRSNGETAHQQTINLSSGLCLTLHAHLLPAVGKPVLFAALDDHKIHIFSGDEYHRVHMLVGHEDWVRGLDVMGVDNSTLLLASASQDTYIRIWRIHAHHHQEPVSGIKVEEKVFHAHGQEWAVKLDAVLAGHEGWVYGVQWQPGTKDEPQPKHRLLSSSLDKTLIIWEPESVPSQGEGEGRGAWTERVRVGEVGGNGLGFYGSRFEPGGEAFMGHGYNGSFHMWRLCKESQQWQPEVVPGGHFAAVEDLAWEPRGRFLTSVSADQTTRVHAPWNTQGTEQWHEIARPQVHGYDMWSLAPLSPTSFASCAEEKVIRVFHAPHNFIHNFNTITGEHLVDDTPVSGPEGASVPSLGLSNKAVFNDEDNQGNDDDCDFVPVHLTEPPTEEMLMQSTLWPETHKLYGHGYEVFALASSPDGELLASACKATTAEHAAVILWNTSSWEQIQKLVSHSLTVTQLAFSPDSQRLLSVSRDRKWTLYQRKQDSNWFDMVAATDKTNGVHARIIWCCAWAQDGKDFGTGSRDGQVCLWSKSNTKSDTSLGEYSLLGEIQVPNASVTALAFAPILMGVRILAVGLESGHIRIYDSLGGKSVLLTVLDNSAAHHLTVKRLSFQPRDGASSEQLLASCGADQLVRLHKIVVS